MTEFITERSASTTAVAAVMGAAMLSGAFQYPQRTAPYEIEQVQGTHSDFSLTTAAQEFDAEFFAQQIAAIYSSFAQRQERLDPEFEAAIFRDIESLYEA